MGRESVIPRGRDALRGMWGRFCFSTQEETAACPEGYAPENKRSKPLDIPVKRPHEVSMRRTLTIDDDLATRLKQRARRERRSFQEVVNEALRAGLGAQSKLPRHRSFKVVARHCGFRPGVNPGRLNQLMDELESDDFAAECRSREIDRRSKEIATGEVKCRPVEDVIADVRRKLAHARPKPSRR